MSYLVQSWPYEIQRDENVLHFQDKALLGWAVFRISRGGLRWFIYLPSDCRVVPYEDLTVSPSTLVLVSMEELYVIDMDKTQLFCEYIGRPLNIVLEEEWSILYGSSGAVLISNRGAAKSLQDGYGIEEPIKVSGRQLSYSTSLFGKPVSVALEEIPDVEWKALMRRP